MLKVFISQPMKGKTEEEIMKEREAAADMIRRKYSGENIEILDTIFSEEDDIIEEDDLTPALRYLGRSIEYMAKADVAVFLPGWADARGCVVERMCADKYGIPFEFLSYPESR